MSKRLLLACLSPALLLGGCGGTLNRGLESVHQPVVSRTDYVFDVAANGYGLGPGEVQRLSGWMAALRVGYGDRIAVDDPSGSTGAREQVALQAARYGLLIAEDAPATSGQIAPGTIRVVVSRMKATVPGCPDFSRMSQPEFNSNTSSNHGCATNASLAAMIADPADLVRGQSGTDGSNAATSYKAIDAYRKAAPSGGGGATVKSETTK